MPKPTHLQSIGTNIRNMRTYRGITQEQLAEEAGLRRLSIIQIESGKTNFEINTLVRIAAALQCNLDIILTPVEDLLK